MLICIMGKNRYFWGNYGGNYKYANLLYVDISILYNSNLIECWGAINFKGLRHIDVIPFLLLGNNWVTTLFKRILNNSLFSRAPIIFVSLN